MSAAEVLSVSKVEKSYGPNRALKGVDLSVRQGEILGFLGPNGAGKTTLMRIVMGLERADRGSLILLGERDGARHVDVRRRIGYLQEKPPIYLEMTARAYLEFFAALYGLPDPARRVGEVLDEVGLGPVGHRALGGFSRGMQQRTCLARVMLHRPEFLILDEPTLGLDPRAIAEMRQSFLDLQAQGTTLLLSSHQLSEVERLCTSVVFIAEGEILASGRTEDILSGALLDSTLLVETLEPSDRVAEMLSRYDEVERLKVISSGKVSVVLRDTASRSTIEARAAVSRLVTAGGFTVLSVSQDQGLESLFLKLIGESGASTGPTEGAMRTRRNQEGGTRWT